MKNVLVLRFAMIALLVAQIVLIFIAATNTAYVAVLTNLVMIYFLSQNHRKVFGWVQFYSILFILLFVVIYLWSGWEVKPDIALMLLLVTAAINVVLSTWVIKNKMVKGAE